MVIKMSEYLKMENITKKFGEVYANKDINFTVLEGEVHTLLGENGAGKSTLMNILTGLYQPTGGEIYLKGARVKIDSPSRAVKLGIGMVHQHFMLVEALTVFENIILGITKDKSLFIKKEVLRKEILELAERYGLDIEIDKPVTEISVGAQQRVEILKALYRGAELLILDEPTAALTDIEVEGLFKIIRKLTAEKKSVIFISHKMREVLEISSRITILRTGQTIKTLTKESTNETELATLMIGKELVNNVYKKVKGKAEKVLELDKVSYHKESKHNGVCEISLNINRGEILGIAGVDGNGQSQLAQLVTGVLCPQEGSVAVNERKVSRFIPGDFIEANVSHVPEDRNKMGLVGNMSVKENLIMKSLYKEKISVLKGLFLKRKAITEYANEMKEKYDIRCATIEQEIRNLSGGNQQKVVLARELEEKPDLLIAVHPTRGLDIGATRYVHDLMIAARDKGCAILLISADFDEVLKLSDRIAVMYEGRIAGVYPGENPPINEISLAMSGKEITKKEAV